MRHQSLDSLDRDDVNRDIDGHVTAAARSRSAAGLDVPIRGLFVSLVSFVLGGPACAVGRARKGARARRSARLGFAQFVGPANEHELNKPKEPKIR